MNNDKKQVPTIGKNNDEWKSCKKLGMLLNTREEWKRRKTLSIAVMAKLSKIWSSKISRKKIRIYSTYVQSIMQHLGNGQRSGKINRFLQQKNDPTSVRYLLAQPFFHRKVNTLAAPASKL